MLTAKETYAKKIQEKIDKLAAVYKQKRFMQLLDEGEIECCERYEVPDFITPLDLLMLCLNRFMKQKKMI